jgi:hypothetical protein
VIALAQARLHSLDNKRVVVRTAVKKTMKILPVLYLFST